jgi:uncharacterized RDD family membrane protein YckC
MRCAHCGYHSFDGLEFCKKCGEPLQRPRPPLVLPRTEGSNTPGAISAKRLAAPNSTVQTHKVAPKAQKPFPPFLLESNRRTSFFDKPLAQEEIDAGEEYVDSILIVPLWRRMLATGVDLVVIVAIVGAFIGAGAWGFQQQYAVFLTQIVSQTTLSICYYLLTFVTAIGYFTVLHNYCGQTLGKMLLRLQVVGGSGQVPTLMEALLRSIGSLLGVLAGGVGYMWIFFDPQRRGWNDRLAGTHIVLASVNTELAAVEPGDEEIEA